MKRRGGFVPGSIDSWDFDFNSVGVVNDWNCGLRWLNVRDFNSSNVDSRSIGVWDVTSSSVGICDIHDWGIDVLDTGVWGISCRAIIVRSINGRDISVRIIGVRAIGIRTKGVWATSSQIIDVWGIRNVKVDVDAALVVVPRRSCGGQGAARAERIGCWLLLMACSIEPSLIGSWVEDGISCGARHHRKGHGWSEQGMLAQAPRLLK